MAWVRGRKCRWCGDSFVATHHLQRLCSDGCRKDQQSLRRLFDKPPDLEAKREYGRKWREANPGYFTEWAHKNPERSREIKQRYAEKHSDRIAERRRELYMENRETVLAQTAQWRMDNIVASREIKRRHRASKRGVFVDRIDVERLEGRMAYFGNKCYMCGGPFEHIDHVKPLAAGGPHLLSNLRPACRRCNSKKGTKWPLGDWLEAIKEDVS